MSFLWLLLLLSNQCQKLIDIYWNEFILSVDFFLWRKTVFFHLVPCSLNECMCMCVSYSKSNWFVLCLFAYIFTCLFSFQNKNQKNKKIWRAYWLIWLTFKWSRRRCCCCSHHCTEYDSHDRQMNEYIFQKKTKQNENDL